MKFRNSCTAAPKVVLMALAVCLGAPSARALEPISDLLLVTTDQALSVCDDVVREINAGRVRQRTLDRANKQIAAAQLDLTHQTMALKKTLDTLLTNEEANADNIKLVRDSLARAKFVSVRLQELQKHTSSIQGLEAAHLKGTFERIVAEAKTQTGSGRAVLDTVDRELGRTGNEQVGTLTVDQITIYDGELSFFVQVRGNGQDWQNDWVEVKAGDDIPLFTQPAFPIRIRAALHDGQHKRLEESRQNARDVEFLDVTDAPPEVKVQYKSASGISTWLANNRFTWKKEAAAASSDKIKAFSARDSSRSSRGDILEVYPVTATVQKMEFTVQANCASWTRSSQLNGKNLTGQVEPEEGKPWSGSAWIVFSVFPR